MSEHANTNREGQPPDPDKTDVAFRRQPVGLLVLWCAVIAIVGGYVCGHALAALAILGSLSFVLVGVVAGWTARTIVGVRGKVAAAALFAACLIACFVALVFRHRLTDPTMSLGDAFGWLGPSLASDKVFATFTIGCAVSGSLLASLFVLRKPMDRSSA